MVGEKAEMKETQKRTLYECSHAQVNGDRIYCAKGYQLLSKSADGSIGIGRLIRGKRLAFKICQSCPDFDCMGPPVPPEERGWLKKKEAK